MEDCDRKEIARLIGEGYTAGRIDAEDEDDTPIHISWELKITEWKDSEADSDGK